ncbi:Aldehyde ferredoxin oxidoreductase [uncultured Desulfobacterium sp.]|uniref:Aldehyde ferredoxin oxidoreductase n=1 Tax=uncultured Desulfobacterium sp. TaxID=201089 RepID=A0A445N1L3_9BACT|nr:Aldehyde ferredoxin oxidoreductase [uncultured Desulfobacterium sp.]
MIRDHFRILKLDLLSKKGDVVSVGGRDDFCGGSGLAALLFQKYGRIDRTWNDPDQPLIFAIGPLTGYFPLMSKTVCAFKSPYHDQYAESHAGGRSALSLRFTGYDALVIVGRAEKPSVVTFGSRHLEIKDVQYLWGLDLHSTGKMLRRMFTGAGHRSILRIGPAGENCSAMACINVDTYRHFGRLGPGAAMGAKNLKAIVIIGDGSFALPEGKAYSKVFKDVYNQVTTTDMMHKYHNLGTPANVATLNKIKAMPYRNLQKTSDETIYDMTGEQFADKTLLRNMACAGCPVGCIHVGFVREKFMEPNQYLYRQVSYDHEPNFAVGSMLGVTDPFSILSLIDVTEKTGLDVMSAGVAIAWATEAFEKGLIKEDKTIIELKFGDAKAYVRALNYLGTAANDFYRLLGQGTLKAAQQYGGQDFACILGQEMAGYATGEVFFVSQALGLRHSHLDAGGYAYDQKPIEKDETKAVDFLVKDEEERILLTSMVSCLFAREVYKPQLLADCLISLGYTGLANSMTEIAGRIQSLRWRLRRSTGFDPATVTIPKRFTEVVTFKGPVDLDYLNSLKDAYSKRILELAKQD